MSPFDAPGIAAGEQHDVTDRPHVLGRRSAHGRRDALTRAQGLGSARGIDRRERLVVSLTGREAANAQVTP